MLDTGAQRQFRSGPCLQGVHSTAREQTMDDLGAGPDSTPISNYLPPGRKTMVESPQLRRQRGPRRRNRGPEIDKWGRWCREAGGNQNKLWHRLVLDQEVTSLHNPTTTRRAQAPDKVLVLHPNFLIPAKFYLPQPSTREHLLSEPNPLHGFFNMVPHLPRYL